MLFNYYFFWDLSVRLQWLSLSLSLLIFNFQYYVSILSLKSLPKKQILTSCYASTRANLMDSRNYEILVFLQYLQ
jgi:hypothetical protein